MPPVVLLTGAGASGDTGLVRVIGRGVRVRVKETVRGDGEGVKETGRG